MSSNIYFDICEDTLISALERTSLLPEDFDIRVPSEMLREMLKVGLVNKNTKEKLPLDQKDITITAAGHSMTIRIESDEPEETQERVYH